MLTQGHTQPRKQLDLLGFKSLGFRSLSLQLGIICLSLQLGIICLSLQLGIVCLGLQLFSSLGLIIKSLGLLDEAPDVQQMLSKPSVSLLHLGNMAPSPPQPQMLILRTVEEEVV